MMPPIGSRTSLSIPPGRSLATVCPRLRMLNRRQSGDIWLPGACALRIQPCSIHESERSVPDGRLSLFGSAVLVESRLEHFGDFRSFSSLDLVPLEHKHNLTIPKQTDRR